MECNKHIDELIEDRRIARESKDWKLSDEIRAYLDERLIFVFDTKGGQEIYYLHQGYFERKGFNDETKNMTNRQYLEYRIQQDIKAEKLFDAWLYSTSRSLQEVKTV